MSFSCLYLCRVWSTQKVYQQIDLQLRILKPHAPEASGTARLHQLQAHGPQGLVRAYPRELARRSALLQKVVVRAEMSLPQICAVGSGLLLVESSRNRNSRRRHSV